MAAKICNWCLKLAEIKRRGVVCEDCLASAYKSSKKEVKIGEKSGTENKKPPI